MQSKRIYPSWEEIENFRNPLTEGELYLARYLDKYLPHEWEIYVQPYMNGDRPDIVILNPNVGLMIFEVKDWNLNLYKKEYKKEKRQEKNNGNNGKKRIEYIEYSVYNKHQGWQRIRNPVHQVERYRQNLLLYLPKLAEKIDEDKRRIATIKIGLYFHNATTSDAREFIDYKFCTVIGKDSLSSKNIESVVPDVYRSKSHFMKRDWAEEIRFWLKPPYHSVEQGQKIILTKEQKRHIVPAPKQHQRLRGVAGSGKTLVIAQRAANLASQGKKVLILTFNITLWHYIKDIVQRARYGFHWEQIEFNHFHGFCKNYIDENECKWPENSNDKKNFFDVTIPDMIINLMKKGVNKKNRKYDAILIDEGQDFTKKYYEMLCLFLTDNDEILLVADENQNIYCRELGWLENMKGTKFRGRWRELKESYRLPLPILRQANKFAELFLPKIGLIPEMINHSLFDPRLIWRNVKDFSESKEKIFIAFKWLTKKYNIHPSDIVILVSTNEEGRELKKFFEDRHFEINDVFEEKDGSKKNKYSFWMGDSRVKMSTIHSFKGWELLNVIILTPENENYPNIDYLMYVAITRTRENLIVFNRLKRYEKYGQDW